MPGPRHGVACLRRIEAQLHEALGEGTVQHEVAGFRVYVWRTPDPFYRNVAVPIRWLVSWTEAIAGLRATFAAYERRARVELFAELWPGLDAVLEAAGFTVEGRAPVMASDTAPKHAFPAPLPIRRLDGATPPPLLRACLEGAAATFHEPVAILAPGELERMQEGLAAGTLRSAVALDHDLPAAGASLAGRGPVAELLGVWTAPAYRRRGLARALCACLLAEFFAAGGEIAWLTAGSSEALSLYLQLGFQDCGTHLDYADAYPADP